MLNISLCMIVKNEEKNLERCLISVKKYVNEIIVVDTGSIDKTKEIAMKHTNKIYDFKWCNDFSIARNYSIEKASNEWILVLDADEEVISFDNLKVDEFMKGFPNYIGRIKRLNIIDNNTKNIDAIYTEKVNRFFNKENFYYKGSIHEQLISPQNRAVNTKNLPITVNHVGYMEEQLKVTDKIERNIKLLEEALNVDPKDPYINYQLGKSFYMKKDYNKANTYFKEGLSYVIDFKHEYVMDLVITYGYSLLNSNKFDESMWILTYEKYYETVTDFIFLEGLIFMNKGLFKDAAITFLKCTQMEEGDIDGVNSYKAYYNIGVIYECLGLKEEAIGYYNKCGDYGVAKVRVKELEKGI